MITRFLFALIVIAMLPAAAQTTSAPQTAEGKSAVHGTVRRAAVVPESLRAPRALRSSTAQTAAVRVDKPLLHTLPGFTVITRDGLSVSSTSLAKKSNWILVYRHAKCLSCDRLMNTIAAGSGIAAGKAPSYVIVVVGKDKAAFSKVLADYAGLSNATWVSDPTGPVHQGTQAARRSRHVWHAGSVHRMGHPRQSL